MKEYLHIKSPDGKKASNIGIELTENSVFGGTEPKSRLGRVDLYTSGDNIGKPKRRISLIERKNEYGNNKSYSSLWQAFKAVGLPVVPTLRKTERGTVVMTDLTADGSEIYGKALIWLLQERKNIELTNKTELQERTKLADKFLALLEGEQFQQIQTQVERCKNLANEHSIILPMDDPFELVVHPNGKWDLVMIDLSSGVVGPHRYPQTVISKNQESARYFMRILEIVKEKLMEFIQERK